MTDTSIDTLAFLVSEILDNYIAPEHQNKGEISDIKKLLSCYWRESERSLPEVSGNLLDGRKLFRSS